MDMGYKNRVMIVDDDREFLEEIADMLHYAGYDVIAVDGPSSVLELSRDKKPDLILIDLKMRPVSGFEVAYALKRDPETSAIPIIAISAFYTIKEHEFLTNICDIRKFFKKNSNPADIMAEIKDVLDER